MIKNLNLKLILLINAISVLTIVSVSSVGLFSMLESNLLSLNMILNYVVTGIIIQCIVVLFSYFLAKSIFKPIIELAQIAHRISKGDLTFEIQDPNSNDEIGQLKKSFKETIRTLRILVKQIRDNSVLTSFNSEHMESSAEQMSSSVQQISSTLQQISKGSQLQAKELDETSQVVEKLTRDMKNLEAKASMTANLTNDVGVISETGSKSAAEADFRMSKIISVTNESAKKIKELADKSREITAVLEVIRKIADQTNLLSLNAAIEAARAGEAGQGFAVVAEEVKRLAEGSSRSSEEIAILITKIQEDAQSTAESIEGGAKEVAEGRIVIDKALRSLNEIAIKVKEVSVNVSDVASATKTQVSEIEKLSKASIEIASVSEQNASATEQASAATEAQISGTHEITSSLQNLSRIGEDMLKIVSTFKLPEIPTKETENQVTGIIEKDVIVQ